MKKFYQKLFSIFLLSLIIITSCSTKDNKKIYIALSKGKGNESYERYSKWLSSYDSSIVFKDLYYLDLKDAILCLDSCSGLILTGGPDVHPFYYNKDWDTLRCEMDLKRDTLEFELIKRAMSLKIPILGICRGQQILNIGLGGSLYVDIPQDYGTKVEHRCQNPDTCFHSIHILRGSLLYQICGVENGTVNTNHHQGIELLSDQFIVSAISPDSFPEAIEWKNPKGKPFLLAVQWHPERMNQDNPLSNKIALRFLEEVKKAHKKNKKNE